MKITRKQIRTIIEQAMKTHPGDRSISEIAAEIDQVWPKVHYTARPYLDAMYSLEGPNDKYGMDSAKSIIEYFLSNASSFKGPDAKRI